MTDFQASPSPAPLTYAMVTPSFSRDFERCQLLVETVQRHVAPHVKHYLVIDRRDVPLFQPLANARTQILVVEDILPAWIHRLPGIRSFWWSWRSKPVKNWILQQIIKLSIPKVVAEEVLLFVDSDVFFTKAFEPRASERDGLVPFFVEYDQAGKIKSNDIWHGVASELLGLPVAKPYDTNFIGNVICWRRGNVLALQERLSAVARRHWVLAIAPKLAFSEYILYGSYVIDHGFAASGHYLQPVDQTLTYWGTHPLSPTSLAALRARLLPHHHSIMISGKSKTPLADIRTAFPQHD